MIFNSKTQPKYRKSFRRPFQKTGFAVYIIIMSFLYGCDNQNWISLFDGENLPGIHYLGVPDPSVDVEGIPRDSSGNYLHGLGYSDPLQVFSIVEDEKGEKLIRISGQVIGGLVLSDSLADYHLRLEFKWGDYKWAWMEGRPKDGGILYHQGKARHEFQIHENDVGSYWARKTIVDIPAQFTWDLPEAILRAKPYLTPFVNSLNDSMLIFSKDSPLHHFEGTKEKADWQIVLASPYNEKPHGEWNTLELICWKNHAIHIVNGKINMVLLNSFYRDKGEIHPLNSGRLTLQSEGAEVFFRNIEYKALNKVPAPLKAFLKE